MRTEQLEYLLEIHKCGSMHKAADKLHISVQALSVSIKALEKELGLSLTVRNKNGTFLTEKGMKVVRIWGCFIKELDKLKQDPCSFENLRKAKILDIFLTSGVQETELPKIASKLYNDFPGVSLNANIIKPDKLALSKNVITGNICLLYQITVDGIDMLKLKNEVYVFEVLDQKRYCCITHNKFAISQKGEVSIKEILKYKIIIYKPTRKLFDALLSYFGETENVMYVESFAVYKQMLKDGHGIGLSIVGDNTELKNSYDLNHIPFKEKIVSTLGIVYEKGNMRPKEIEDFCKYLKTIYV